MIDGMICIEKRIQDLDCMGNGAWIKIPNKLGRLLQLSTSRPFIFFSPIPQNISAYGGHFDIFPLRHKSKGIRAET